jgi:hypothetical protein
MASILENVPSLPETPYILPELAGIVSVNANRSEAGCDRWSGMRGKTAPDRGGQVLSGPFTGQ